MSLQLFGVLGLLLLAEGVLGTLPHMQHVHAKFQFKHSFKGPYVISADGRVPFWTVGGSAIPSDDQVRVCPSIKSRRGWMWSKELFNHRHWMVDVKLRITGRLKHGADGMAFWFTTQQGEEGAVFGNVAIWNGLAVILDSFDNDGLHDNPKIQVVINNGTTRYEHGSDGLRQESGSCLREFRNRPNPVKLRIIYLRGMLEVWVHDGMSSLEDDYDLCVRVATDQIPVAAFFGITAATGGLSDDHDVLSFITHSLTPLEEKAKEEYLQQIDKEKAQETENQYQQMAHDFDQKMDEYYQEHPEYKQEPDWQYEIEMEQNVRHIVDMQTQIFSEIQRMSAQLDTILQGGAGAIQSRPGDSPTSLASEIAHIKTTESNILHQLADLRAAMDRSVPQGSKVTASEQMQPMYETKALVQQANKQLASIEQHLKGSAPHQCPPSSPPSSCTSPVLFIVGLAVQLAAIVGYMIFRERQERAAKKFF